MKKTLRLPLLYIINIFISLQLFSQSSVVQLGNPHSLLSYSESPAGLGSTFVRTQYRLSVSEMNAAGLWRGIWTELQVSYQGNSVYPISIYLKESSSTPDTGIVSVNLSDWVYQGYIAQDSLGWTSFQFQNAFSWSGAQDVIIQFCVGMDTIGGAGLFYGTPVIPQQAFRSVQSLPYHCETAVGALAVQYRPALKITQTIQLPSADSIHYFPYNGFVGLPPVGALLRWQDVQPEGPVTQYELLLDTVNPPGQRLAVVSGELDSFRLGNLIPGKTYFWKIIPINPTGSDSTGIINYFTTGSGYCSPPVLFSGGSKLSICQLNNVSFYTGDTCTQFVLHQDSVLLTTGDSLRLQVQRTSCSSYRNWYLSVALDRNADGDFQDIGEALYFSTALNANSHSASFLIPSFSLVGFTRFRIMISEAAFSGNWCQPIGYGEVEDFQVRGIHPAAPQCSTSPSSLHGLTNICPETPLLSIAPGSGSITHYLIQRDTNNLFLNPDSFMYSSSMPSVRFPDTLQPGGNYYYRCIPVGPGGNAAGCAIESFSTSINPCTDTACVSQTLYPLNIQSGIYPSAVRLSWPALGGVLPDSIQIVWDTLNPPIRFHSGFFSGTENYQLLLFPEQSQTIYWKPILKNRNGILRNCPSTFTFSTLSLPCRPQYTVGNHLGDYISRVSIGGQTRISGPTPNPEAYEQADSMVFTVQAGTSITLIVSPGSYPGGNYLAAWIDLNRNGLWESAEKLGEVLVQASAPASDTIVFILPACADTGYSLLRIRESWGIENIEPCTEYPYGEVEDYPIYIQAPLPIPPLCPNSISPVSTLNSVSSLGDTLRWMLPLMGSCPNNVRVYLGSDNPPGNILSGLNRGLSINLFTDSLQANTQYYWKVVSENAFGQSINCPTNTFRTCAISVPPVWLAPIGIGCDRATVLFQPRPGINTYQVQVGRDSLFSILHPNYVCSTLYHTDRIAVSGLSGQSRWFARIRSVTDCDTGTWSICQPIQLLLPPPAVIMNPSQSGTCQEIQVSWQNSPGAISFQLDVSSDSGFQSFLSGYNQRIIQNASSHWVGGLRASRNYYARMRAVNSCGLGAWSPAATYTTGEDSWVGMDSLWHRPWNWCSGNVPDSLTDVRIPGTLNIQPVISTPSYCRNLLIEPGARLRQSHQDTFTVYGNWYGQGSFRAGLGTVFFKANAPKQFFGRDTFNNINIYNIGGIQIDSSAHLVVTGFLRPMLGFVETRSNLEFIMDSVRQSGILPALSPLSGIRGEVRMKQTFSRTAGNRLLTSPFTNTAVGYWWNALGGYTDAYRYVETALGPQQHGFQIMYDPTDTVENGRGYYVTTFGNTQLALQGNIRGGTINYPVTWTVDPLNRSASGWNLIGNPYLCPINWNSTQGWQRAAISNAVFYLNPANGQQVGYINGVGTQGAGPVISPGQGFWVKATGVNTQLILDERAKIAQSGKFFRETQNFQGYRVQLKNEVQVVSEALIRQIHQASPGFDIDWDAEYPGQLIQPYAPQIWLNYEDSLNFVIQSLDISQIANHCRVCLDLPQPGTWHLNIEPEEMDPLFIVSENDSSNEQDGIVVKGNSIQTNRPVQICPWKISTSAPMKKDLSTGAEPSLVILPNPCPSPNHIQWRLTNYITDCCENFVLALFDNLGRKVFQQEVSEKEGVIRDADINQSGVFRIQLLGQSLNLTQSFIILNNRE